MNPRYRNTALFLLFLGAFQTAQAAKIYTCERNGETVYTSKPSGSCHSADLPSIGRYSSARYDAPPPEPRQPQPEAERVQKRSAPSKALPVKAAKPAAVPAQSAASAPAVSKPASGGNSRRSILEQELANERKALGEAQKSLSEARAAKGGAQQINQLQSSVLDRQQNIQALQRELGRM